MNPFNYIHNDTAFLPFIFDFMLGVFSAILICAKTSQWIKGRKKVGSIDTRTSR